MINLEQLANLPDGSLTQDEVKRLTFLIYELQARIRQHDNIVAAIVMSVPGRTVTVSQKNQVAADAKYLMYQRDELTQSERVWYNEPTGLEIMQPGD